MAETDLERKLSMIKIFYELWSEERV
jgi:hypothetical protein